MTTHPPPTNPTNPPTTKKTMKNTEKHGGYPPKTPKTTPLTKWGQEITQFINQTLQKRHPTTTKKTPIPNKKTTPRKYRKDKWYRFSTQSIRREIARGLGKFYESALQYALDKEITPRERERWGRLVAYTAQTINSITTTYDDVRIEETLHELKQYIQKHT
jgi:hypothetical protein